MTKFWPRNVRIKRPTTSTEQILANASYGVSSTRGSAALSVSAGTASGLPERGAFEARSVLFVILCAR
jgi:hypothetical protein